MAQPRCADLYWREEFLSLFGHECEWSFLKIKVTNRLQNFALDGIPRSIELVRVAARSENRLAVYPVGIVRGQEHGNPANIFWLADPAEGGRLQA